MFLDTPKFVGISGGKGSKQQKHTSLDQTKIP
jgi:hypothetical protein